MTSFEDSESVNKFVKTDGFQCAIGIHAWRAGRLLLGKSVSKLTQYKTFETPSWTQFLLLHEFVLMDDKI